MKAFAIPCWKNRLQFPLRWNSIPLARIAFGFFISSNRACYCCWTRKDSSDYHFFPFSKAISKRSRVLWGFVSFRDFRFILMLVPSDWNASNCQITRAIALKKMYFAMIFEVDNFFQCLPINVVRRLICNMISQSIVVKPSTMVAINILWLRQPVQKSINQSKTSIFACYDTKYQHQTNPPLWDGLVEWFTLL